MGKRTGAEGASVKRIFWDIETAPNIVFSWRIGREISVNHHNIIQERAIICICYKWEGEKKVHYLTWDRGDDKKMLEEFAEVMEQADEMVAHNGDRFDLRWFNARNLIHGLEPIPAPKTVDTLKIARKHFLLNSNALDYLGKLLFGKGKIKTDFSLWVDIVLHNSPSAMKKMVKYCKGDVRLLERVWGKLRGYEAPKTHAAVNVTGNVKDRWRCPHCGSGNVKKSKTRVTAKGMVQFQMQCLDCGRYYSIANAVFNWYLKFKQEQSVVNT